MSEPTPAPLDAATLARIEAIKAAVQQALRETNGDRVAARQLLISRGIVAPTRD